MTTPIQPDLRKVKGCRACEQPAATGLHNHPTGLLGRINESSELRKTTWEIAEQCFDVGECATFYREKIKQNIVEALDAERSRADHNVAKVADYRRTIEQKDRELKQAVDLYQKYQTERVGEKFNLESEIKGLRKEIERLQWYELDWTNLRNEKSELQKKITEQEADAVNLRELVNIATKGRDEAHAECVLLIEALKKLVSPVGMGWHPEQEEYRKLVIEALESCKKAGVL